MQRGGEEIGRERSAFQFLFCFNFSSLSLFPSLSLFERRRFFIQLSLPSRQRLFTIVLLYLANKLFRLGLLLCLPCPSKSFVCQKRTQKSAIQTNFDHLFCSILKTIVFLQWFVNTLMSFSKTHY